MQLANVVLRPVLAICFALNITCSGVLAQVQAPAKDFEPQIGQRGKDVIWVPTPQALVDRMMDMAKVTPQDYVIDLGSGDGRTVITAAKLGAKALGIEYNPDMVELSKRNAIKEGLGGKANFVQGDIFQSDFSQATVVTMFLLSQLNLKLRPILLDMKPGTRVVSNTFDMGDWQADQIVEATGECTSYCRAYLWIIPAKVDGTWQMGQSELTLEQTYQMVKGTLKTGNVIAPIMDGRLAADRITFTAGGTRYAGVVRGTAMDGTAGGGTAWQATRR
ncbi:MAG: class I SAM-dependent methyltransferase [Hyphomonadaceae bacterium]|jgi:SAM-dependent methyltransferase|nr:class I SAM-dependent methyltransferase [Hyphomonadaceae bacterium]